MYLNPTGIMASNSNSEERWILAADCYTIVHLLKRPKVVFRKWGVIFPPLDDLWRVFIGQWNYRQKYTLAFSSCVCISVHSPLPEFLCRKTRQRFSLVISRCLEAAVSTATWLHGTHKVKKSATFTPRAPIKTRPTCSYKISALARKGLECAVLHASPVLTAP